MSESNASPDATREPATEPLPRLGPLRKSVYALGDVTVNMSLSAMGLIYASYFLTQVADLRPALAGLVPLVGRAVDAFTDPLMGEISDRTRMRSGRRRPWFLIGAIPFGVAFALLWQDVPSESQAVRFGYYAAVYCLMSVTMTIVSVPYLAILPEMATGYDERTSLNTYRTVGALVGTLGAVSLRLVADAFGGGAAGFAWAGAIYGVLIALPWFFVFRATFERPSFQQRRPRTRFVDALREVFAHRTFTRLTVIYIMGRIAMDLASTLIILYTTYWLGRSADFELVMGLFLGATIAALPVWLVISRGREKSQIFIVGAVWWMVSSAGLALIQPDWPRWILFVFVPFVGVGYAVVDLMPWSMLGEVIDEDDLASGERREGIYNGVFTFIRKLGGALGVFFVMSLLDLAGFKSGAEQTETARQAIRYLTAFGPAIFLLIAVCLARGYPLTRRMHSTIIDQLDRRDEEPPG